MPDDHSAGDKIKRSLVLAGGGVRLAYHAGVLMALEEEGITFNHVDGTSGGIFGAAMMASGITPAESASRWRKLKLKGFISVLPFGNYLARHHLRAMGSAAGIRGKIFPALGIQIEKINANHTFDATFNVCNFSKKTIESIPHTRVTEDHLIAGMSLPVFMPAVYINDDWYTDGVWIKDANLTEAVNRGAEDIWLIWCIGNTAAYLNGFFNQYVHMIEMSASGALFAEIEWLKTVNEKRESERLKPVTLHIVKPEYPLPLDPDFFLNRVNADTLINWGYEDTRQYLKNKQPFGFSGDPSGATAMKNSRADIHFRQQFKGKTSFNGQLCSMGIQLSFFIRQVGEEVILQQFSSVAIDGNGFMGRNRVTGKNASGEKRGIGGGGVDESKIISGYNNRLLKSGQGQLKSEFNFIFDKQKCSVQMEFRIKNVIDFLLGLEIKTANVRVSCHGEQGAENIFRQPGVNRIKNALHLYTKAETGWFGKQRLKHRILIGLLNDQP